jgi:cell division protein FtsN
MVGGSAAKEVKTGDTVSAKSAPPTPPVAKTEVASAPVTTVSKPAAVASSGISYSVQVAAYNQKAGASKLASTLVKRGYAARVDGETAPFRVRIGRYSTAGEAEKALARIKAKHISGFVLRVPER